MKAESERLTARGSELDATSKLQPRPDAEDDGKRGQSDEQEDGGSRIGTRLATDLVEEERNYPPVMMAVVIAVVRR